MSGSLGSINLDSSYDRWKLSNADDETKDSRLKCCECSESIYPEEYYYDIEGSVYCEEHAKEWLESFKKTASHEDCYGI